MISTLTRAGVVVLNTATGVKYRTIQEAAIAHGGSTSALFDSMKRGHRFKGAYWERVGKAEHPPRRPRIIRQVVNCYTDEVFRSTVEAASSIGVRETCMRTAIKRGSLCKGVYWDWSEEK